MFNDGRWCLIWDWERLRIVLNDFNFYLNYVDVVNFFLLGFLVLLSQNFEVKELNLDLQLFQFCLNNIDLLIWC